MKHGPTNINVTVIVSCNFYRMIRTYRSHLRFLRVPLIILFVTISLLLVRTTVFWRVLTIVHYTFDCLVSGNCPSPSIPNRSVSETGSVSIHTQTVWVTPTHFDPIRRQMGTSFLPADRFHFRWGPCGVSGDNGVQGQDYVCHDQSLLQ